MRTTVRRGAAGAALLLVVVTVVVTAGNSARADDVTNPGVGAVTGNVYDLYSQAVSVQSVYTSLSVPFNLPVAIGSYGAEAKLLSSGESVANAGAPYSPLVSSLPGTGNGVAQNTFGAALPVVPTFPGFVSAQFPGQPVASQSAGVYALDASTTPFAAEGRVNIGAQGAVAQRNNLFALARTTAAQDTGALAGYASAGAVALTLPGILDLGNVFSEVTMQWPVGERQPAFASRTSLGTISAAGLTTGVTDGGVQTLGGAATPLTPEALPAINAALAPLGITLTYLPQSYQYTDGSSSVGATPQAKKTVRGLTSAALQIYIEQNVEGQGVSTETITVGQTALRADGTAPSLGVAGTATSGGSAAAAGPTAATPAGAGALDAAGLPYLGGAAAVPGSAGSAFGQVPTVNLAPTAGGPADLSRFEPVNFSVGGFYPVLLVVGALFLAGSWLTRRSI